jgi:hypothetical protein
MLGRKLAVVGFRAHSGWAAAILLAGPIKSPTVVLRDTLLLTTGPKQPYHAAESLPLREAESLIANSAAEALKLAESGLRQLIRNAKTLGLRVGACAQLQRLGSQLPPLESILKSHALIHTAEGEHYRAALRGATHAQGLTMFELWEPDAESWAENDLGIAPENLPSILKQLGHSLGSPWTQDQKLASLAAWMALQNMNLAKSARTISFRDILPI